jgi:nitrite reductase (NADH) small subunit
LSVTLDGTAVRVCATADVPLGEGRPVTVGDRRIAVFHTESGWYALDDACPHRGGPLSDGLLADRCVACPLHDRRFALEDGSALTDGAAVASHRVSLRGDEVHVEIFERLGCVA